MSKRNKNYTVSVDYTRGCFFIWDGNGNYRPDLASVEEMDAMAKKIETFLNKKVK